MKKLLAVLLLMLGVALAISATGKDDADARYLEAQKIIQEALKARLDAERAGLDAQQKYEKAVAILKEVQAIQPGWKSDEVAKAVSECESMMAELRGPAAPPPPVPSLAPLAVSPSTGAYVGNKTSRKVHRADCQWGEKTSPGKRVYFKSWEEAQAAGYVPCKICKPDQETRKGASAPPPSQAVTIEREAEPAPPGGEIAGAAFIGHQGSKKVHSATCTYAQKISDKNRVAFTTYEEAIAAGYVPCKTCKPDKAASRAASPETKTISASAVSPPPDAGKGCCASMAGKYFHRPECEWAKSIPDKEMARYATREEAIAAGKQPCNVCKP